MHRYLSVIVFSAALMVPLTVIGQERQGDRNRTQTEQQATRYQDRAHNSHEWNAQEDVAYRRYLQEHHKKYREFTRNSKTEQYRYWDWRKTHPDAERR